jgi:hypothetical protein
MHPIVFMLLAPVGLKTALFSITFLVSQAKAIGSI